MRVDMHNRLGYVQDMPTTNQSSSTPMSHPTNASEFVQQGRSYFRQVSEVYNQLKSQSGGIPGIENFQQIEASLERFWSSCEQNPQIVQQVLSNTASNRQGMASSQGSGGQTGGGYSGSGTTTSTKTS